MKWIPALRCITNNRGALNFPSELILNRFPSLFFFVTHFKSFATYLSVWWRNCMELCFFTTSSSYSAGLSFYASDMSSLEINYFDLFYLNGTREKSFQIILSHCNAETNFQGEKKIFTMHLLQKKNIYFRKKIAQMSISKIKHLRTFLLKIERHFCK